MTRETCPPANSSAIYRMREEKIYFYLTKMDYFTKQKSPCIWTWEKSTPKSGGGYKMSREGGFHNFLIPNHLLEAESPSHTLCREINAISISVTLLHCFLNLSLTQNVVTSSLSSSNEKDPIFALTLTLFPVEFIERLVSRTSIIIKWN